MKSSVKKSAKVKKTKLHPVTQYAEDILNEKIISNRWVKLACKRHIDDLKTGHKRGLYFDENAATNIIEFYPTFFQFYEGAFDGMPFYLTPHQSFLLGSIFGWKREKDGFRRFRTVYIEEGKGNGKTPLSAGVGLYGLGFDDEPGSEIYSAATTKEQAGISFRDARLFAESSEEIRNLFIINEHNIAYPEGNSFFRPISSEKRGLDGKKPHIVIIDEIHEHPSDIVVRKMSAGTKTRRQSIIFEITNSGYDINTICYQHHEYTTKVLEGIIQDDAWFGVITGLDPCKKCRKDGKLFPQDGCPDCDDWRNSKVWEKANPNIKYLGEPFTDYLQRQVNEAIEMPSQQNIVKRLNFCIWTEGFTQWLPADSWNECGDKKYKIEDFIGKPCYLAFDLANKIDIASLIIIFQIENDEIVVFNRNYLPEETIKRSRVQMYHQWVAEGHIIKTAGAMTDYRYIEDDIKKIGENHQIMELSFDPKEATYLIHNVMNWLEAERCIEVTQGPARISEPMKQLEGLVYSKKIHHDCNPVLSWMVSNVVKKESKGSGPVKYYYPTKTSNDNKIDGAVALIMAIGSAMIGKGDHLSAYQTNPEAEIMTF